MSAFDDLDALTLDAAQALFGDTATLFPMKPGPSGVNGASVADDDRPSLPGVPVIRSEWSERVQIGGQGLPTPPGHFGRANAGARIVATVRPAALAWVPRKGDELVFDDRPDIRYRVSEPMPDGGAGLHLGLTRIQG